MKNHNNVPLNNSEPNSESLEAARIKQLESLLYKEKEISASLDALLEEKERRINEARAQINVVSASKFFKLSYLLYRWRHQGFSCDAQERKAFYKWLLQRNDSLKDIRQYNPLMLAVDLLDGKTFRTDNEDGESLVSHSLAFPFITSEDLQQTLAQPYQMPDIIVLGIIGYHFRHQRPQHFAQRLAQKGHRVFYINPDYSTRYSSELIEENLWQITFNGHGHPGVAVTDWHDNADVIHKQFDHMIYENAIRDAVVVVDFPNWVYCARYLREKYGFPTMTDYMDDFTGFLNPAEDMIRKNCHFLLQESERVLASSQFLYDIAAQYTDKVAMVRNGTEFDYFHQIAGNTSNNERKVIGYYGAISTWFHADMVCHCAEQFPECDVVLVGEVTAFEEQLKQHENIRLIGEIPYAQLLPWLQSFDVCLIPFDTSTDLIKATNPVKFYEYLSAGKKIVATEIPELEPYRNQFVYLENDPDKFCEAVRVCLDGTDVLASAEECYVFAKANDWDARTQHMEQELHALFPKISVIVLCYNQLDYTKQCVESILKNTAYPNYELILVDNNSSDDTAAYLTDMGRQYGHVKVILNETNRGFAGGNNDGIAAADGDYILLLNNDTVVARGWLTGMLRHFTNDSSVGLVGPITNSIGNEARIMVSYEDVDDMPLFAHDYVMRHMGEEYPHGGILAMYCLMISRAAYEKIGPLDENYGIGMFEDDDYSVASVKAGFRNVMAEDVFIHHFGKVSFTKLEDEVYKKIFDENKAYFENKWKEPWQHPYYRPGVT